jgi:hypothetical protein
MRPLEGVEKRMVLRDLLNLTGTHAVAPAVANMGDVNHAVGRYVRCDNGRAHSPIRRELS